MSLKGGFQAGIKRARAIGCETVQIFPGNPTGWRMAPPDADDLAERARYLEEMGIYPLVIHSAYLINLASPSPEFYEKSKQLLRATMEKAALYSSPYVVLHTGNHGGQGVGQGLDQIIKVIGEERVRWPSPVKLLLENTSGSGTALGSRFEELARILEAFPRDALGVCFDTAHAWGAGYDLGSGNGAEEVLSDFDKTVGLDRILAVHVNDSKAGLGSRIDRHEHIGKGKIGLEGLRVFLHYGWPRELPVILETPEMGTEWDRRNLEKTRELMS